MFTSFPRVSLIARRRLRRQLAIRSKVAGSTPVLTIILPIDSIRTILFDVVMVEENFFRPYMRVAVLGLVRGSGVEASPRGANLGSFVSTASRVKPQYSRLFVRHSAPVRQFLQFCGSKTQKTVLVASTHGSSSALFRKRS